MATVESFASFLSNAPVTLQRPAASSEPDAGSKFSHLKWLTAVDQREAARGECAAALRDEEKVLKELRGTVRAYRKATEHLRVAGEFEPGWHSKAVQDSHSRRIDILLDTLSVLEADPLPPPAGFQAFDGIRSRVSVSFAHAVQATSHVAAGLEEVTTQVAADLQEASATVQETFADKRVGEQIKSAADAARSAFSTVTLTLSDAFGVGEVNDELGPLNVAGSSSSSGVVRMGCTLRQPVELLHVQRHGSSSYRCAVAEMQGWRFTHEDAHAMVCKDGKGSFWVLDGHGGEAAALFAAPELARRLCPEEAVAEGLPTDDTIRKVFEDVDQQFRDQVAAVPSKMSGSTVVGVLAQLSEDGTYSLKLANCGDSRALIFHGTQAEEEVNPPLRTSTPEHLTAHESSKRDPPRWPMVLETIDHKPDHPTERSRVEAAGGMVTQQIPPRVDGILAVSRALGDFDFKRVSHLPPSQQRVSCEPDVYEAYGLPAGAILVLACDGIWDVMSSGDVADFVRTYLKREPKADLGNVAADLVRLCMSKNSYDNMTAMIVSLEDGSDWHDSPDEVLDFDALTCGAVAPGEGRQQHVAFLARSGFPAVPTPCPTSNRWLLHVGHKRENGPSAAERQFPCAGEGKTPAQSSSSLSDFLAKTSPQPSATPAASQSAALEAVAAASPQDDGVEYE